MKNTMKLFLSILIISFITSCTKDDVKQLSQDNLDLLVVKSEADFIIESDVALGNDAAVLRNSFASGINAPNPNVTNSASCATITVLEGGLSGGTFNFPFKIKVDFGDGCTNANGVTRKGIVTIEFSNFLMATGSTMTIVRGDNYYINQRKVEGTIVYTNITTNPSTPSWTRVVIDGKVTRNGQIFLHEGNRTVVMMVGAGTPILADNVYHITAGMHTVTKPNGDILTTTVLETLVKPYTCQHITQGQISLEGQVLNGVLDYGTGTCDNQAIYTHSNGITYNITL
jgi:hypothetical protein